jgi:hypothetical protein
VRLGNRPNDREPEPGAAAPAGAVGPREALERALAEPVGKAGPVVSDVESKLAVRAARLEADLCAAVAERVVHHVRQRLLQPQPVAADTCSLGRVDEHPFALRVGTPSDSISHRLEQVGDADRFDAQRQPPRVRTRDQEQVLRQLRETLDLPRRPADGFPQLVDRAGVAQRKLELRTEK